MHVHHTPDLTMPTRADALGIARQAGEMGMRAIVIKNQSYPTAPLAAMVSQLVPEVKVFGSISQTRCPSGVDAHPFCKSCDEI